MNQRQARVAYLMQQPTRFGFRELYEGSNGHGGGCGEFWLTYSADVEYQPLTLSEVHEMRQRGVLAPVWPDKPSLHFYRWQARSLAKEVSGL